MVVTSDTRIVQQVDRRRISSGNSVSNKLSHSKVETGAAAAMRKIASFDMPSRYGLWPSEAAVKNVRTAQAS